MVTSGYKDSQSPLQISQDVHATPPHPPTIICRAITSKPNTLDVVTGILAAALSAMENFGWKMAFLQFYILAFFEKSKVACPELYEKIATTLDFQYVCSVNLKLQPGHGYVRLTQRLKIRGNITCLLNLCKKKKIKV